MLEKIDISYINKKYMDVEYGNISEAQKLDIYLPEEGQGPFPVIVSIHGGAFLKGDKQDNQLIPMLEGLNRGYAVISINYRLSGESIWPAQIMDVKNAIEFIKSKAEKYLLDKNRVAVWGGSAGGHLSAMVGTSTSLVNAVVDWFGPIDFLKMDEQLGELNLGPQDHNDEDSPESRLLGAKITEVEELVKDANPITYITKHVPPFFIQHGNVDNLVPYKQSEILYTSLVAAVGTEHITFEILDGARHGGPHFRSDENIDKVFNFLDKNLK